MSSADELKGGHTIVISPQDGGSVVQWDSEEDMFFYQSPIDTACLLLESGKLAVGDVLVVRSAETEATD